MSPPPPPNPQDRVLAQDPKCSNQHLCVLISFSMPALTFLIWYKGHRQLGVINQFSTFLVLFFKLGTSYYYYYYYWFILYSAILHPRADSLRSHVILHEWIAFYSVFLNIHRSGVLTALAWLVPQESAARESQSQRVLCTPYNHAPCHFMQSHIRKVHACLAVTCHLRFWQNDRGLLRATAVTRGWNGYQNKSQHRKLTLEKKIIPPLRQGFEPTTFRSRVRSSNHWAIPTPLLHFKHPKITPGPLTVLAVKGQPSSLN